MRSFPSVTMFPLDSMNLEPNPRTRYLLDRANTLTSKNVRVHNGRNSQSNDRNCVHPLGTISEPFNHCNLPVPSITDGNQDVNALHGHTQQKQPKNGRRVLKTKDTMRGSIKCEASMTCEVVSTRIRSGTCWTRRWIGELSVEVDGHTTNVDQTIPLILFAANSLARALCTAASADSRNWRAASTDLRADGDREAKEGEKLVNARLRTRGSDGVAALNWSSVALATASRGRMGSFRRVSGSTVTTDGGLGREATSHTLSIGLSRDGSGSSS